MHISGSNSAYFPKPPVSVERDNSSANRSQASSIEAVRKSTTEDSDKRNLRSTVSNADTNQLSNSETRQHKPQQIEPVQARDIPAQETNIRPGVDSSATTSGSNTIRSNSTENKAISSYLTVKNDGAQDVQSKDSNLIGVDVYV